MAHLAHKPRSRSHEPKCRRTIGSCYFGYMRATSLDWLPDPILKHVLSYLDWRDLLRLAGVNQRWLLLTNDPELWFRFVVEDGAFHPAPITRALSQGPENYNWKIPFIQRKKAELLEHKFQPKTATTYVPARLEPKQKWYSAFRKRVKNMRSEQKFNPADNYGSSEIVIAVLGDQKTGKSCLIANFLQEEYSDEYDPTMESLYTQSAVVCGTSVNMRILDTTGQQQFQIMEPQWIEASESFLIVFAVDNPDSFERAKQTIKSIQEKKCSPIVLVGTKIDVDCYRAIGYDEVVQFAKDKSIPYIEVSAKASVNVGLPFNVVVKETRYHRYSRDLHA